MVGFFVAKAWPWDTNRLITMATEKHWHTLLHCGLCGGVRYLASPSPACRNKYILHWCLTGDEHEPHEQTIKFWIGLQSLSELKKQQNSLRF